MGIRWIVVKFINGFELGSSSFSLSYICIIKRDDQLVLACKNKGGYQYVQCSVLDVRNQRGEAENLRLGT